MPLTSSTRVLALSAGLALSPFALAQQSTGIQPGQPGQPVPNGMPAPVRPQQAQTGVRGGPISNLEIGLPPALDAVKPAPHDGPVVQVAMLLDTSNSMDGLIDQARAELWTVINSLRGLQHDTGAVQFQVALYQYGNNSLEQSDGYVQLRVPFTTDLDTVSQQLFALTTNGGNEYCGWVIGEAANTLAWTPTVSEEGSAPALRLMVVAGNEPFTQGDRSYSEAIPEAIDKDVRVHTVFCGSNDEGMSTYWDDGAALGNGFYFAIDQNSAVQFRTQYDDLILGSNTRLNSTYLNFNNAGQAGFRRQLLMDTANEAASTEQAVQRAATKSSTFYSNSHWDIVDRHREGLLVEDEVEEDALPEELQGLSFDELTERLDELHAERVEIQKEIAALYVKREQEVAAQREAAGVRTLGMALSEAIIEQAREQGFTHADDDQPEPVTLPNEEPEEATPDTPQPETAGHESGN